MPVRKIDHFLGLFFSGPFPGGVCARLLKDPARRGMILPRPRVHRSGLDDFIFINSKKDHPLDGSIPAWRVGITVFPVGDHTGALSTNGNSKVTVRDIALPEGNCKIV